jgi:hypothetical protein
MKVISKPIKKLENEEAGEGQGKTPTGVKIEAKPSVSLPI